MSIVERERVEEVVAPRKVTDADVLKRGADLIEEFGWCQGVYGSKDKGAFCAHGALQQAIYDLRGCWDGHLYLEMLNNSGWFMGFNDTPGRTKEEVVAALRTAAEKARQS